MPSSMKSTYYFIVGVFLIFILSLICFPNFSDAIKRYLSNFDIRGHSVFA